jgi:integrase
MSGYVRRRELPSGKVRYSVVIRIDGKEQQIESYTYKKDADTCLRRTQSEIAAGTFRQEKQRDITFNAFYERWIKSKDKTLKPSTRASYEHTFRLHILPWFGDKMLGEITPLLVQDWVTSLSDKKLSPTCKKLSPSEKTLSPASVTRCYRYLRSCLKQAEAWGLIVRCPCRSINLPRTSGKEIVCLNAPEVALVLENAREPERSLFALLALSGLRRGEALGLAWKHINFRDNAIIVERAWSYWGGFQDPKTASSKRAVPLLPSLATVLRDYSQRQGELAPDDLLFSYDGAKPFDPKNVSNQFERAVKAAGVKRVTLHSLRHTFASLALEAGWSIKALQRSLGHASATMTLNTYSHMIQEDPGSALLRMDAVVSGAGGKVVPLGISREIAQT